MDEVLKKKVADAICYSQHDCNLAAMPTLKELYDETATTPFLQLSREGILDTAQAAIEGSGLVDELAKQDKTLRDEIAIAALHNHPHNLYEFDTIAKYAYCLADAMLKARGK